MSASGRPRLRKKGKKDYSRIQAGQAYSRLLIPSEFQIGVGGEMKAKQQGQDPSMPIGDTIAYQSVPTHRPIIAAVNTVMESTIGTKLRAAFPGVPDAYIAAQVGHGLSKLGAGLFASDPNSLGVQLYRFNNEGATKLKFVCRQPQLGPEGYLVDESEGDRKECEIARVEFLSLFGSRGICQIQHCVIMEKVYTLFSVGFNTPASVGQVQALSAFSEASPFLIQLANGFGKLTSNQVKALFQNGLIPTWMLVLGSVACSSGVLATAKAKNKESGAMAEDYNNKVKNSRVQAHKQMPKAKANPILNFNRITKLFPHCRQLPNTHPQTMDKLEPLGPGAVADCFSVSRACTSIADNLQMARNRPGNVKAIVYAIDALTIMLAIESLLSIFNVSSAQNYDEMIAKMAIVNGPDSREKREIIREAFSDDTTTTKVTSKDRKLKEQMAFQMMIKNKTVPPTINPGLFSLKSDKIVYYIMRIMQLENRNQISYPFAHFSYRVSAVIHACYSEGTKKVIPIKEDPHHPIYPLKLASALVANRKWVKKIYGMRYLCDMVSQSTGISYDTMWLTLFGDICPTEEVQHATLVTEKWRYGYFITEAATGEYLPPLIGMPICTATKPAVTMGGRKIIEPCVGKFQSVGPPPMAPKYGGINPKKLNSDDAFDFTPPHERTASTTIYYEDDVNFFVMKQLAMRYPGDRAVFRSCLKNVFGTTTEMRDYAFYCCCTIYSAWEVNSPKGVHEQEELGKIFKHLCNIASEIYGEEIVYSESKKVVPPIFRPKDENGTLDAALAVPCNGMGGSGAAKFWGNSYQNFTFGKSLIGLNRETPILPPVEDPTRDCWKEYIDKTKESFSACQRPTEARMTFGKFDPAARTKGHEAFVTYADRLGPDPKDFAADEKYEEAEDDDDLSPEGDEEETEEETAEEAMS